MEVLKQIEAFAGQAHGHQKRRYSDEPYIAHPVRVKNACAEYTRDIPVLAAALLHDVLEDTEVTEGSLQSFLYGIMDSKPAAQTLNLVKELTDVYTKDRFPQWNRRKRKQKERERIRNTSADAQTIKYADIIDNCNETALRQGDDFAPKFLRECRDLLGATQKGDPELYKKAVETVEASLEKFGKPKKKQSGSL